MTRHERERLLEPSKDEVTVFISSRLQKNPNDGIGTLNSVRESIMKSKKDKMLEQHKSPISYSKNQVDNLCHRKWEEKADSIQKQRTL